MAPPSSQLPAPRTSRRSEVKKHVGAVHMKGALSLLERKVTNVLLLNAYDDLPDPRVQEHEIRLRRLAEMAGFDSNDLECVKDALGSLVKTSVEWNILDPDGEEEWGVSALLASAKVRGGWCTYAYSPEMRRRLFNPSVYARINLLVQERFRSSYALALYENCVRYRAVNSTGWHPLETWRDLLGVEKGQYPSFKYLNRDVLKPAIAEINRSSDIRIEMKRQRKGRSISALLFAIDENYQQRLAVGGTASRAVAEAQASGELPEDLPDPRTAAPSVDELLRTGQKRMLAFGLTAAQAIDLSTKYGDDQVARNLSYVEGELSRGRLIRNLAAYTVGAIRGDYAGGSTPEVGPSGPRVKQSRVAAERAVVEERRRDDSESRAVRLDAAWEALGDVERSAVGAVVEARLVKEYAYVARERERRPDAVVVTATLLMLRNDELERRGL